MLENESEGDQKAKGSLIYQPRQQKVDQKEVTTVVSTAKKRESPAASFGSLIGSWRLDRHERQSCLREDDLLVGGNYPDGDPAIA